VPCVGSEKAKMVAVRPDQEMYDRLLKEAKAMRRSLNQHVLAILYKHFADEPK